MNQIYLYSVDTTSFYTKEEQELGLKLSELNAMKAVYSGIVKMSNMLIGFPESSEIYFKEIEKIIKSKKVAKLHKDLIYWKQQDQTEQVTTKINRIKSQVDSILHNQQLFEEYLHNEDGSYSINTKSQLFELINKCKLGKEISALKKELNEQMAKFKGLRKLKEEDICERNKIAQFESMLTRTLKINKKKKTTDFMIVRIYHYSVMEQLIKNGYTYKGQKYIYLMSSSGQIRNKKCVFIKKLAYIKHEGTLLCGLTEEIVNTKTDKSTGELLKNNSNKWIAYKALVNSNSTKWNEFDQLLENTIVVPDFEFTLKDREVEFINKEFDITPEKKDITIPVMDGAGICLPSVSEKCLQFRGVWFKGLLVPMDFRSFVNNEEGANKKVTDVWGKEWDIEEDDIRVIFTASQFKLWRFYDSWDVYVKAFKKNKCEFSICDVEADTFDDKPTNYQMIQTLYNMNEEDLKLIANDTVEGIKSLAKDTNTMLEALGATEENEYKKPLQEALMLYPALLSDAHVKKQIRDKKKSMINDARAGKLIIPGSKRCFISPDVYAFSQWLFGIEVTGLLEDGEVSSKLYNDGEELDVLRSPHNYMEHCVRRNVVKEGKINEYFTTKAIYTSIHDTISLFLMFDVDGDQALVINNETFVNVAKKHMQGIKPLQYELGVGEKHLINKETSYNGLTAAFKANIGILANDISKNFNSGKVDLTVVKYLTYLSNIEIDHAKTLFSVEKPEHIKEQIKKYTDAKLPYFFKYAKDKKDSQIEEKNNSVVNQLEDIIVAKNISFPKTDVFNFEVLMNNKDIEVDEEIKNKYDELLKKNHRTIKQQIEQQNNDKIKLPIYQYIKDELLSVKEDLKAKDIADILVKYTYSKNSENKDTLWNVFGEQIVVNIKRNLGLELDIQCCEMCEGEYTPKSNNQKFCVTCKKENDRQQANERKKRQREVKKVS